MSELARKLIKECLDGKKKDLDLGNCGLDGTEDELYRQLADADHLETLIFSNKWNEYDEVNTKWEEKKSENPGHKNVLIKIPVSLPKNLTTLIATIESNNGEVQDYTFLKKFIHLKKLYLHDNQIGDISFLESLTQLQSLYLYTTQLRSINLKDLKKLEFLELNWESIQEISLEGFEKLKYLGMDHTALRSIYLKNLLNLQTLALTKLSLEKIVLQSLQLTQNRIQHIPSLNDLPQLQSLHLSSNCIQDITFLKDLPQLQLLTLRQNNIKEISLEFLNSLPSLNSLYLFENPIKNIPKEIYNTFDNALPGVCRYLEDLAEGANINREVKVILIGNGDVGKTQIAKRLAEKENYVFQAHHHSTHGISLSQCTIESDIVPEGLQLNIWDFGGQDIYHATHRLFMQTRALFLLVWDKENEVSEFHEWKGRKYKNEKIRYWLEYAKTIGYNSPILILQNKVDLSNQKEFPKPEQKKYHYEYPAIYQFLRVSAKIGKGFPVLEDTIGKTFKEVPSLRQELLERTLPVSWIQVRDRIRHEQANPSGLKQISVETFQAWCKVANVEDSTPIILQFFHDSGVLYYQKEYFSGKIILDQAWAIEAIYKLLDREGSYFEILEDNEGKLTHRDLCKIWQENTDEERTLFMDFMLSAELCFKTTISKERNTPLKERTFVVPQLLREDKPGYISIYENEHGLDQVFEISYRLLPEVFIHRFIVQAKDFAEVEDMWQKGIYLQYKGQYAIVEADYENSKIIMRYNKSASALISAIQDELEAINRNSSVKALQGEMDIKDQYLRDKGFEGLKEGEIPGLILNQKNNIFGKPMRDKIFISYSHKDKEWLEKVQVHLKVLEKEGIPVNLWDDTQIKSGMKWRDEIEKALAEAKVALLLVSTDFLGSDFITKYELPSLLKAAEDEGSTILPLILKPCRFTKHKDLGEFQAENDPTKPLSSLSEHEQDEILVKLMDRIEELMDEND